MANVTVSRLAGGDLGDIADYTIETFGIEQARRYRDGLDACFQMLAATPLIGRDAGDLAEGLRSYPHQSHVVFYRQTESGVLIVRVLHRSMDFERHL